MPYSSEKIDDQHQNYNLVKDIVVERLVKEGYLSEEEGYEFCDRIQILLYKASWFKKWFIKQWPKQSIDDYYIKAIEVKDKETNLDDLIRRTAKSK